MYAAYDAWRWHQEGACTSKTQWGQEQSIEEHQITRHPFQTKCCSPICVAIDQIDMTETFAALYPSIRYDSLETRARWYDRQYQMQQRDQAAQDKHHLRCQQIAGCHCRHVVVQFLCCVYFDKRTERGRGDFDLSCVTGGELQLPSQWPLTSETNSRQASNSYKSLRLVCSFWVEVWPGGHVIVLVDFASSGRISRIFWILVMKNSLKASAGVSASSNGGRDWHLPPPNKVSTFSNSFFSGRLHTALLSLDSILLSLGISVPWLSHSPSCTSLYHFSGLSSCMSFLIFACLFISWN